MITIGNIPLSVWTCITSYGEHAFPIGILLTIMKFTFASSLSPPIPTENTEEFWNQYRRNTRTSFIGKLLKRALSTQQGPCLGARYITKVTEGGVEESLCSENEELYDEMYQELYQDVFQEQSSRIHCKKRHNTREKMEMIL